MDPRLRAAVDASRRWYDDVFALHGIPVRRRGRPVVGARPAAALALRGEDPGAGRRDRAGRARGRCASSTARVADSFGDLELDRYGFELLFEATLGPPRPRGRTAPDTASGRAGRWSTPSRSSRSGPRPTTTPDVLPPAVLDHPRFRILACRQDGRARRAVPSRTTARRRRGALERLGCGRGGRRPTRCSPRSSALHPGRPVTDFARGRRAGRDGGGRLHGARPTAGLDPLTVTLSSLGGLPGSGVADYRGGMGYQVEKTDEQWREELSPEEYAVLRKAGTERPFVGEYTDTETKGVYSLQGVPGRAVRVRHQVPLRLRLAELLPADHRHRGVHRGRLPRDEAGRGALRQLRLPPRPRLPRRLRHPHRRPLLHQLDRAHPRARRRSPPSSA